jgi:hypothetical protein
VKKVEESGRPPILEKAKEILHQGYNFAFEYHKHVKRLLTGQFRADQRIAWGMVQLAKNWMHFVLEWCVKGCALSKRWPEQGLSFLIYACDPNNLATLTDEEYIDLQQLVGRCIEYTINVDPSHIELTHQETSPFIQAQSQFPSDLSLVKGFSYPPDIDQTFRY